MQHLSESLIAVLNEQIRCAEAMLRALGVENQALLEGNAEQLNAAGADKARLVEALENLETERRTLADAIGASLSAATGDAAPQGPPWQTLLGLVAACKDQNQRNGALVKARTEQVRIALKTLRGADEPDCYDPTGLKAAPRAARRLGSA